MISLLFSILYHTSHKQDCSRYAQIASDNSEATLKVNMVKITTLTDGNNSSLDNGNSTSLTFSAHFSSPNSIRDDHQTRWTVTIVYYSTTVHSDRALIHIWKLTEQSILLFHSRVYMHNVISIPKESTVNKCWGLNDDTCIVNTTEKGQ